MAIPLFGLSRRTNLPPVISLGQVRKVEFPWYYKVQTIKNLPAMQEIWVRSLGGEDPLEEEMAPSPVFFPGESHGQRSLAGYSPWVAKGRTRLRD